MKGAAKLLEMQDVYDEIHRIQNGDKVEINTAPQHSQPQTLTPLAPVVPVENSDDSLPSWFNFALPHYDIRNGQLDESIFVKSSKMALRFRSKNTDVPEGGWSEFILNFNDIPLATEEVKDAEQS